MRAASACPIPSWELPLTRASSPISAPGPPCQPRPTPPPLHALSSPRDIGPRPQTLIIGAKTPRPFDTHLARSPASHPSRAPAGSPPPAPHLCPHSPPLRPPRPAVPESRGPRCVRTCLDLAWAAVGPFLRSTVTVSQSLSAMAGQTRQTGQEGQAGAGGPSGGSAAAALDPATRRPFVERPLPAPGAGPPPPPIGGGYWRRALPASRGQSAPGSSETAPGERVRDVRAGARGRWGALKRGRVAGGAERRLGALERRWGTGDAGGTRGPGDAERALWSAEDRLGGAGALGRARGPGVRGWEPRLGKAAQRGPRNGYGCRTWGGVLRGETRMGVPCAGAPGGGGGAGGGGGSGGGKGEGGCSARGGEEGGTQGEEGAQVGGGRLEPTSGFLVSSLGIRVHQPRPGCKVGAQTGCQGKVASSIFWWLKLVSISFLSFLCF